MGAEDRAAPADAAGDKSLRFQLASHFLKSRTLEEPSLDPAHPQRPANGIRLAWSYSVPEKGALMPGRDMIVIGTSAGGVEALSRLVRGLPADLPASLFVVLHFPAGGGSVCPHILSRSAPLPAQHAADGAMFQPGRIYVAPPD